MPLTCPKGHSLTPGAHPAGTAWCCDECGLRRDGGNSHGCRACNYDACAICFAADQGVIYYTPNGNPLTPAVIGQRWRCDGGCGKNFTATDSSYGNRDEDVDYCTACVTKLKTTAPFPPPPAAPQQQQQQSGQTCCYWLQGKCNKTPTTCPYSHVNSALGCQYGTACRMGHQQLLVGGSSLPTAITTAPGKCTAGHPLVAQVMPCKWRCDGCSAQKNAGETSFGCRVCDQDRCSKCATVTSGGGSSPSPAPAALKPQNNNNNNVDDQEEGYLPQPTAQPATPPAAPVFKPPPASSLANTQYNPTAVVPAAAAAGTTPPLSSLVVTCTSGHIMKKNSVAQRWRCDGCHTWSPDCGGSAYSCRPCNFDVCDVCAARRAAIAATAGGGSALSSFVPLVASSPSSSFPPAATATAAPVVVKCAKGHPLVKNEMRNVTWRCDNCSQLTDGGFSYGCRQCNYDVDFKCLTLKQQQQQQQQQQQPAVVSYAVVPIPAAAAVGVAPQQLLPQQLPQGKATRCRCLFVGINYPGTSAELNGCINDVAVTMKYLKACCFDITDRRVLVDCAQNKFPAKTGVPTKRNIEDGLKWLVDGARPGDSLWWSYSGHGTNVKDPRVGFAQALVPSDYTSSGLIRDDWIFDNVVRRLPAGVRLTAVNDCCHSGSLLNLERRWRWNGEENQFKPLPRIKKRDFSIEQGMDKCDADVIAISGCQDSQTSSDVSNVADFGHDFATADPGAGKAGGAMTNSLAESISNATDASGKVNISLMELFFRAQENLKRRKFAQIPQLTASHEFDMNQPFQLLYPLKKK